MGETYKDGNTQRTKLSDLEINQIVDTFVAGKPVENFCVCPSYDEIKDKGYSLSAGQYYDVKIEHIDITEEEFNKRILGFKKALSSLTKEGDSIQEQINKSLGSLLFVK